ncbi:DUF6443 domain-containing protein [Chitinophaga ginsengisoli]|uniref:DUF6443 domain-containing protein n=1 Tax=Chitinophaga ginsengisoli TaxID=363837 RepID=A0A2P8FRR6_9BACT|nr:DUF6443 domain-containing protein [Chitinophaga ginsengisoli]PSL24422.1 hypothetical protein CLV42_1158 [Chitinophaga ginsengisoli]
MKQIKWRLLLLLVAVVALSQTSWAAVPKTYPSTVSFPFPLRGMIGQRVVTIEGPGCVLPGFPIGYYSTGTNLGDNSQWCVNGGSIQGTTSTCKSGTPVPSITVTFTADAPSTQISLTVNGGSFTTLTPVVLKTNQINISGSQQVVSGTTPTPLTSIETAPECSGFTYLWQQRVSGGSWTDITTATSATYSVPVLTTTTDFRRQVSANGNSMYSNEITISVTAPLSAGSISNPVTGPIVYNGNPGTITSTTPATGGTGGSYVYIWQKSTNGTTYTDIPGASATSYAPGNLMATTYFRRKASIGSETQYSNVVTITVYPQFVVGNITNPVSAPINYSTAPGTINGPTVSGGGCSSAYTYRWQASADGVNYTNINGATTLNYNPGTMTVSRYIRLIVTCGTENKATNAIYIQVYPAISPGTITASQTIDYNQVPAQLTGSVASGGNGTVGYQWQSSTDNITFTGVFGATVISYGPPALTATTYYRRAAQSNGATAYSNVLTITVTPPLTSGGTISPATKTINYNTSPGQLTGTVPSGGGPVYDYLWQSSDDNATWSDIGTATGQHYTPGNLTAKKYFRRKVTSNGSTNSSNTATINVYPALQAGSVTPASSTISYNTVVPTLTANPTGGNGSYSYVWQTSTNNSTWTDYPGSADKDLDYDSGLIATTWFRVIVTSNGVSATSASVVVNVLAQLKAGVITPNNPSINYNTAPGNLSVSPTGGNGTYTYQWQFSGDNSFWQNVGTSSNTYTPGNLTEDTYYRCLVTSGGVTSTSQSALINVYPPLTVGAVMPLTQTILPSAAATPVSCGAPAGGSGSYTYVWQKSINGTTWTDIANSNALSIDPGELSANTYYRLKVTSNGVTVYSTAALVQVQLTGGLITASASSVAPGGTITLASAAPATNGSCGGSYTYIWQKSANEMDWTDFASATISNIMATSWYRREVTCGSEVTYSNTVIVRVNSGVAGIPDTVTMMTTTQPVATMPAYGSGASATNMNYMRTRIINKPGVTTEAAATALTSPVDVEQETEYFDGLGRSLQTVTKQVTTGSKDLITLHFYDPYGRESLEYKGYGANTSDGNFKTDPATAQPAFYNAMFGGRENFFYKRSIYDNSPDGDVLESRQAGKSFEGNARGKRTFIRANRSSEAVRIWDIGYNETDIPTSTSTYASGSLQVTETTDEDNNKVIKYTNRDGRVVLSKQQNDEQVSEDHTDWLCTYYVYDEMDKLRCIITPKAVEAIKSNWVLNATVYNELCFSHYYDSNGNPIISRKPGYVTVENVYDGRERKVFSRTNLEKNKGQWSIYTFDALNRPIMNGFYVSPGTRAVLQDSINNYSTPSQTISKTYPNINLVLDQHDGSPLYQATNSITLLPGFDSDTDVTTLEINAAATGETLAFAPDNFMTAINTAAIKPNVYLYYDDYNFPGAQQGLTSDLSKPLALSNYNADAYSSFNPINTSLATGIKNRVLGTDQWLTSTLYYTPRRKLSQTVEQNLSGATTVSSSLYNFKGTLLSKYVSHTNAQASETQPVLYLYHLNLAGKTDSIKVRFNNDAATQKTVAYTTYNELNQISQKKVGVTGTSTQLETFDYGYTLNGDITTINEAFVNTPGSTANWFGLVNSYDKGFNVKFFSGLMSGTKWKSRGDGVARAMAFSYDNSGRLAGSSFNQQNQGSIAWQNNLADFSSNFRYDENGNIVSTVQKGLDGPIVKTIDSLEYGYFASSNKLNYVKDYKNETGSKRGDFNETTNDTSRDYWYDANNNLTRDKNKGIDSIRYNEFNLPEYISIPGKGTINFVYTADGKRLRKTVNDVSVTPAKQTVTDYMDVFTYQNDTLQQFTHDEGRVRLEHGSSGEVKYTFDYFVRDPVGNTRMVLGTSTDTSRYMATMESQYTETENLLFSNIDNTRSAKPSGYPADATTIPNSSVAKLNAQNGQKIGPSIVLRVMAGDTIQAGVKAFYKSGGSTSYNATATDMLNALLSSFNSSGVLDGVHQGSGANSPITAMTSSLYNDVKNNDPSQNLPDRPKAYLTYAAFDDQFNLVSENSAVRQVQNSPDILQTLATGQIVIKRTGFIYIYVNNENGQDVYFDNLSVIHNSGPLLEETHYYPYGLTMAGISSHALKGDDYYTNRKKYNGIEFNSDLDINEYEAQFRTLDPQVGRWLQMDPKTDEMENWSPYASNYDNPIRYNDFLGDEPAEGPGDPIKQFGLITGNEYKLTAPKDFKSSIQFAAEYTWGTVTELAAGVNKYINPVYAVVNGSQAVVTGKDLMSGEKMNASEASMQLLAAVPVGKVGNMVGRLTVAGEKLVAKGAIQAVEKTKKFNLSSFNEVLGMAKTQGKNFTAAAEQTREFAKGINKSFVQKLKAGGTVVKGALKQYERQMKNAIRDFEKKGKDFQVQEARFKTIKKILKLW